MKNILRWLLSLNIALISFSAFALEHNFQLKNKTGQTLYLLLGSKKKDPANLPKEDIQIIPAYETVSKIISFADYPEFILSTNDLRKEQFQGSEVFAFEIEPIVDTKYIYVEATLEKSFTGKVIKVVPSKKEVRGWFGKKLEPIKYNITDKQILSSTIIYKPKKIDIDDAYTYLTNLYKIKYHEWESLNKQSSPFALLALKPKAPKAVIQKRFEEIQKSVNELEKHPDKAQLYQQAIAIITKAKNDALKNL